jgi:hypothetical protein
MFANGFRLGQSCKVDVAFFGDAKGLVQVKDELLGKGYTQDTTQTDEMLVFSHSVALGYDSIGTLIAEMKLLAERSHVTFDGWSVET